LVLACVGLVLVAACGGGGGGGGGNSPDPRLIAGGGAGDGAIDGTLHVHVVDGVTGQPVVGASVRVGDSAATSPLQSTTDATGLASFKDGALKGKQMVTVTAATYAAATWVGANAANLTIPLEATQTPAPATARAEGTIQGWDTRPAPAQNHLLLAYIGYSFVEPFDAPENGLVQDTQDFFGVTLPTNICAKAVIGGTERKACNWKLKTRVGKQIHWAVVIDLDTKGTLSDRSDDTFTVVDYAFLMDQTLAANETKTGEVLVPVGAGGMTSATVALQAAPAGIDAVAGLPLIRMGDSGDIALSFTPFGPNALTQPVPALTGGLASAAYDFVAHGQAAANLRYPQSTIWKHGVSIASPVDFGAWLTPPTSFGAQSGTYVFSPAADASTHTVKFLTEGSSGPTVAWNVALLDGSTSFALPSLSPSPLPTGQLLMRVEALALASFDPEDFSVTALRNETARRSAGQLVFTR
jgi:hypothetical protein